MTETATIDRGQNRDTHAVFFTHNAVNIQGQHIAVGDIFHDGAMVTEIHRHDNPNYPNQAERPYVVQCSSVVAGPDGQPQPTAAEKRPRYIPPKLAVRVFRTLEADAAAQAAAAASEPAPETPTPQEVPVTEQAAPAPITVVDLAEDPLAAVAPAVDPFAAMQPDPPAPTPIDCICIPHRADHPPTTASHLCHGGGYACTEEGLERDLAPYGHAMTTIACEGHWGEFVAKQAPVAAPAPIIATPVAPVVPIAAAEPVPAPEPEAPAPIPPAAVETPVDPYAVMDDPAVAQVAALEDPANEPTPPPVDPEDPTTLAEVSEAGDAPVQISAEELKKLKQSTKRLAKKYAQWMDISDDELTITPKF